jgi:uncharacterized protein
MSRGEVKTPSISSGMILKQQHSEDTLLVDGYGAGGFKIRGSRVKGSMLILRTGFHPLDLASIDDLTIAHFDKLLTEDHKPELVLIGTGERMTLLPPEIKAFLREQGIGFDPMDTGAAARTYNILNLEARRVAALLIAIE